MRHYIYMDSPVGMLTLGEENGYITHILFGKRQLEGYFLENDLLSMAKSQLDEYFDGVRKNFALPLMPEGTDFQKSVWRALTDIDYGTTATYGQIAEKIGSPKAARAVGMANNKNPVAIVVP